MITASELGMLCARHRIKSASWLTEGARSWFKPKAPQATPTTPQSAPAAQATPPTPPKPPTPPAAPKPPANPLDKYAPPAGLKHEQTSNYFNPPKQNERSIVTTYKYMQPLYAKYPGGFHQAIDDSQRWREHAQLEGLPTWESDDLHKPIHIATGSEVPKVEKEMGIDHGFTRGGMTAGGYQTGDFLRANTGEKPASIFMSPNVKPEDNPAWWKSALPHEITHAMHRRGSKFGTPVFKGHEASFARTPEITAPAFPGDANDSRTQADYYGTPTEHGAYLSELRRHWIENHPGKRISTLPEAEEVLKAYVPASEEERNDRVFRYSTQNHPTMPYNYMQPEKIFGENEQINEETRRDLTDLRRRSAASPGAVERQGWEEVEVPARNVPDVSNIQKFLPAIMSNPTLKRKALIQLLHSVVQNKQRQAPGTNV
jgi:hypothetical protein